MLKGKVRGILFDMDGTLTRANLDFDRIRKEIGIQEGTILEYLETVSGPERARGFRILERHEEEAARTAELNPGAKELLARLAGVAIKTALITRNSRRSVETICSRHGLEFDAIVSREDARPKPAAEPFLLASRLLGIPPAELVAVGDHKYDLVAGRGAGIRTILFVTAHSHQFLPLADHAVDSLEELLSIVAVEWT